MPRCTGRFTNGASLLLIADVAILKETSKPTSLYILDGPLSLSDGNSRTIFSAGGNRLFEEIAARVGHQRQVRYYSLSAIRKERKLGRDTRPRFFSPCMKNGVLSITTWFES